MMLADVFAQHAQRVPQIRGAVSTAVARGHRRNSALRGFSSLRLPYKLVKSAQSNDDRHNSSLAEVDINFVGCRRTNLSEAARY